MNIIEAIQDEHLLGPFIGDDLTSWKPWMVCLRAIYGLPIRTNASRKLIAAVSGRKAALLPTKGFTQSLFLTGRRSGKSKMAAICGAFEAALSGRESKLSKGEIGMVAVISPTKHQSNIVKSYLRAIFDSPLLAAEIIRETREGFELRNGVHIGILAGDWRTVRGFSLLAAIVDEVCFLQASDELKVKSDTDLINAITPSLATTGGRLIGLSSPYARKGWAYRQWKRCFGNDKARTLVLNAPSRTMNPTLPQSIIDAALTEDYASARAEYLAEWRDDCGLLIPREVVEQLVVRDRSELMPRHDLSYSAFVDLSGGRADDAALAIAHSEADVVIVDAVNRWQAPFNPHLVIIQMAKQIKRFGIISVTGDNYSAEFVSRAFEAEGLTYLKSEKPKSQLYVELLPRICSNLIELPDNELLVAQLSSLERRTRSGGRDIVDHPSGGHDDVANAVAGVADVAAQPVFIVGAY